MRRRGDERKRYGRAERKRANRFVGVCAFAVPVAQRRIMWAIDAHDDTRGFRAVVVSGIEHARAVVFVIVDIEELGESFVCLRNSIKMIRLPCAKNICDAARGIWRLESAAAVVRDDE